MSLQQSKETVSIKSPVRYPCTVRSFNDSQNIFFLVSSLPPATKLGQGYVFTGVCDSVHRGVSASVHAGIPHPPSRHPPEQTPPREQTPPVSRHPLPRADTHTPEQTHTTPSPHSRNLPGQTPPQKQSMVGDTVNARAVRILLECNLV